ncbi:MAG: hypothetical protein COA71_00645 [SAR86 cluster bacterium]|uniref:Uncharacterized protein n=1 Tax=SAR86 cluster bacterium TaxID=2030880 RepID=A0A2A5CHP7_9GAMM|nr:MAG: hypothetical protein COA71_00645 [SAR86 cluster bacterium]
MMLYKLPTVIFYPLLLIWSIVYGGIAGFIFKIIEVYENWRVINHQHLYLWKKYPHRSYRKYIENMWSHHIKGKPVELAEYEKIQLERSHPEEPFPLSRLLLNSVFMVFITPFMALSGLYYGPVHVFTTQMALHNQSFKNSVTECNN